ncbi:type I methionyl aminopeptidase [bacterium]|nr:type I methionyl aminopeptidase [candidate division CSSED10-310 bacterium]
MIFLKSANEIEILRKANQIVAETLEVVQAQIKPGVTTAHLDKCCEEYIRSKGAEPAFKGYRGFPNALCISLNEEVVHGIPGDRQLQEGDIASCDVGVKYKGFFGDSAATFPVGKISTIAADLIQITEEALYLGIEQAIVGNRLYDIGNAVQYHVEKSGFSVVKVFVGHGIGRQLHEDPQIPNYGPAGRGVKLRDGMVLAIEPMVNIGTDEIEILPDGWTAVTKDGSLSAHFEHSIVVRDSEAEILSSRELKINSIQRAG